MQTHSHICFLDEQPIHIVTPLLDSQIDASEIIIFINHAEQDKLHALKQVLIPRAIKVHVKVIPNTRRTEELVSFFHQEVDALVTNAPDTHFTFNASCGDRQHVLAMYEVVRAYDFDCYMVEPDNDELHWLVPTKRKNTQLTDTLKIRDFFTLIESEVSDIANSGTVDIRYRQLGAKWAASQDSYAHALSHLNYLAATSDNPSLTSAQLSRQQINDPVLQTLIDDLYAVELITRQGDKLAFFNEEARFFANGGWLEDYVYGLLLSLKKELPHIQDIAQGVEVTRSVGRAKVKNELDIVVLANNKLHLIECKTKKFDKGEGNQVIYKLDSLCDLLGGIDARAALVSYKGIRTSEQIRAKELDIAIICEDDLARLKDNLRAWLQAA